MDNLIKQLHQLPKKRLPLRADFNLRAKLYKMIWQKRLEGFSQLIQLQRLKPVPVLIIILLCLFIIVPGYAYASDRVTRNHPLYPLKQGIEKVEVSLALSAPAKVNTYTKLTDRRLAEAEILSQQNQNQALIETIDEAVQLAGKAEEETQNIAEEVVQNQVQATINQAKQTQQNTLANIAQTVGIKAEETVLDSIALAFEAIKPKWPEERDRKSQPSDEMFKPESAPTSSPAVIEEDEEETETVKPVYPLPKATDTDVAKPKFKKQEIKDRQWEMPASLNQLQNKVKDLKADITEEEYEPDDINALFDRLNNKMEQAKKSWQDHNLNNFDGLIKSTDALTNNARHFIKPKNRQDKNKMKNFWQTRDNEENKDEDSDGQGKNKKKFNKWDN